MNNVKLLSLILVILSITAFYYGWTLRNLAVFGIGTTFFLILMAIFFKKIRNICIPVISIGFIISFVELTLNIYWAKIIPVGPRDTTFSEDSNFVYKKVNGFGYLGKEGRYNQKKIGPNKEVIYNVTYTIGSDGYRLDVPDNYFNIHIYGDSNLFGEGINDNETLSYFLYKNHGIKSKNMGIGGFGMHQALHNIQKGKSSKDGINILFTNLGLATRSSCKPDYSAFTPRYILNNENKLVRNGVCETKPWLYYFLHRSYIFKIINRIYESNRKYLEDEDVEIYLSIIKEISRLTKLNNSKLIIAYMTSDKSRKSIKKSLKFSYNSIISEYNQSADMAINVTLAESYEKLSRKYYIHELDTHATAYANIDRASLIADAIYKLNYKKTY